jgi:hypothetical protein
VLEVREAHGRFERTLPADLLVSFSVQAADPGYGPERVDDLVGVFGGLTMMPGYAGGLVGTNSNMADEVVGLAAWRDEAAFDASIPDNAPYEVTLYEPVDAA